jgi:hypothetical protein
LNYLTTLGLFAEARKYGNTWMDTRNCTDWEWARLKNSGMYDLQQIAAMATKKRVSNQLGRLYRMGLVKRKRTKRKLSSKNGKIFNRGFCYSYSLSKQGQAYLEYKKTSTPLSKANNELKRILSIASNPEGIPYVVQVRETLPRPIKDMSVHFVLGINAAPSALPLQGRYHRFAPRLDTWPLAKIKKLGYENVENHATIRRLEKENKELKDKLIMAELKQSFLERILDGFLQNPKYMHREHNAWNADGYQHLIKAKHYFSKQVKRPIISADTELILLSEGISHDVKVHWSEAFNWIVRQMRVATKNYPSA